MLPYIFLCLFVCFLCRASIFDKLLLPGTRKKKKISFYLENCPTLLTVSEIEVRRKRTESDNFFAFCNPNFSLSSLIIFNIGKEKSVPQLSPHVRNRAFGKKKKKVGGTVLNMRLADLKIWGVSLALLKHLLRIAHRLAVAYQREESWICNQKTVSEPDHHLCQLQQSLSVMLACHFDSDDTFTWCLADIMLQLFTNRAVSCTFTGRVGHLK